MELSSDRKLTRSRLYSYVGLPSYSLHELINEWPGKPFLACFTPFHFSFGRNTFFFMISTLTDGQSLTKRCKNVAKYAPNTNLIEGSAEKLSVVLGKSDTRDAL